MRNQPTVKLTGIVAEQGFVAAGRSLWPFAHALPQMLQWHA
jgi:hypothetical protein